MDVERALRGLGRFAPTLKAEGTLDGVFEDVKVQFLWAKGQQVLEDPTTVAGMAVGSLVDLFATKVKMIGDRGELRDYFDLMRIEQHTGHRFEEGLDFYVRRYQLGPDHPSNFAIVRSLGSFNDVERDPYLEQEFGADIFDVVRRYWDGRQPEIVGHLDQYGVSSPDRDSIEKRRIDEIVARSDERGPAGT